MFMFMRREIVSEMQPPTGLLFVPQMIYEYGEPWWNNIARKTEEVGDKPVPVPLYPPQVPHELTWVQTRASIMKGQLLPA
jgi:hypothetical protein